MLKNLISHANWPLVVIGILVLVIIALVATTLRPKEEMQHAVDEYPEDVEFLEADFKVEQKARLEGVQDWDPVGVSDVKVGDVIQFQTEYQNWSEGTQERVVMSLSWAEGLEFVPGSVLLYNTAYPDGNPVSDPALAYFKDGSAGFEVNLGNYATGANAYLRFSAVVTEVDAVGSACFATVKNDNVTLSSATVVEFAKSAES